MRTEIGAARGSSAVWRVLEDELARVRAGGTAEPHVVDVGGGTGVWAVPLAAAGCRVTVVEPNQNALATLRRRAREREVADRIDVVADDTDALRDHVREGSAELVLAHGLFEVVDDPNRAAAALAATVVPGGAVSVLAANRFAAVLHRALAGRLTEARHLLTGTDGVLPDDGESILRRFDSEGLRTLLESAGLELALLQGDGVVSDSLGEAESGEFSSDELTEFETAASMVSPLRDVATRLHALARRV
ncbi:SAM-dependent methyltransferase [Amycolatopsis bartoniae]|uniref:Methyltransferase n=1 Tax=Amycolatopsis bartoniae TaxID=941986 RepID=A0A8H9IXY2_9PSEU|nr:methyltransferase domain-containing protein [Amycolatopsis bartoniae]MBB2935451.1 SAM-dependent methyltransferase [Amycolatopsis bartoniae]TVT04465.1 methyltransferase domain-containing protein [Amycolatopsis bartoniae]GHF76117.1 methyltransferase [Amycolatopsis bartoniae]